MDMDSAALITIRRAGPGAAAGHAEGAEDAATENRPVVTWARRTKSGSTSLLLRYGGTGVLNCMRGLFCGLEKPVDRVTDCILDRYSG